MGTSISYCYCCEDEAGELKVEGNNEKNDKGNEQQKTPRKQKEGSVKECSFAADRNDYSKVSAEGISGKSENVSEALFKMLAEGVEVSLILQDKSKINCLVKISADKTAILLTCDKKEKKIFLKDVKNLLHTPEQLNRVDCSAGIGCSDFCVAVHLHHSSSCIPFFFKNNESKSCFLQVVESILKADRINKKVL